MLALSSDHDALTYNMQQLFSEAKDDWLCLQVFIHILYIYIKKEYPDFYSINNKNIYI